MTLTRNTCSSCRFRMADDQIPMSGQCRRYPPIIVETVAFDGSGFNHFSQYWPFVSADDWCGEYQSLAGALLA